MMPGSGNERAAKSRGRMRASDADREQMVDTLKAAFVQGRLTKDDFDARIGRTLASRTYAELATITADIPARPAVDRLPQRPPGRPPQRQMSNALRWGVSGFVTPAVLAAAFLFGSLRGGAGYEVMAFVVAFGYFMFWLSAGADMLWQWHSMQVPSSGMCVRCAHTAASHRAPASCSFRQGSLKMQGHCLCAGYVPPGVSPRAVDLRPLPARYP
jgi:uncharacterized protein DUF1707